VDVDDAAVEIEILDPEPEDFDLAQSGAIGDLGHEPPRIVEQGNDSPGLLAREDGGKAPTPPGADDELEFDRLVDAVVVPGEVDNGIEDLPLGGGRAVALEGDVFEIGVDGIGGQAGDALAEPSETEVGEFADPGEVGFFGRRSEAAGADLVPGALDDSGDGRFLTVDGGAVAEPQLFAR